MGANNQPSSKLLRSSRLNSEQPVTGAGGSSVRALLLDFLHILLFDSLSLQPLPTLTPNPKATATNKQTKNNNKNENKPHKKCVLDKDS